METEPQICIKAVRDRTLFSLSADILALLDADEADDLLMPLAFPGNSYSKICLNNLSFGVDAARTTEPILSSLEQLTDVYLSDFTAGRPVSEAVQVMEIFSLALEGCNLKTLSLSHNSLGEKGVRAFGALLKCQSNLEELYLVNAGITKEAATAFSEPIPCTEKLKVLHFDFNRIGDEGAISIAKVVQGSPSLEDFRCATSRIGPKGGVALVEALGNCANLKKLDLMDNMFGKEAAIPLTGVLSSNAGLTETSRVHVRCTSTNAKFRN